MHIVRDVSDFIVGQNTTIKEALKTIRNNKSRTVFVVSDDRKVLGSLTDGDVRDYIINAEVFDAKTSVMSMMNTNFKFALETDRPSKIKDILGSKYQAVPILKADGVIKSIAKVKSKSIQVAGHVISKDSPSFIISEIGNNHNGDVKLAKELVTLSKKAGVDCVKFQMRDLESLYANAGDNADASEDLGSQYTLDLLSKFSLTIAEMLEVFDFCKEEGILALCTPWDLRSLEVLENYGIPAYKIASADLTNHELLFKVAETGKPMFISTGMSSEQEVIEAIQLLEDSGANYILLHCNSTYPTPYKDIQLKYMPKLGEMSGGLFGYSGHERGIHIPVAAVAMGAKVIEKHFTVDKSMEGNDHKVSLLPEELSEMVKQIRQIEESLIYTGSREMSQGELMNREVLGKSLVLEADVKEGHVFKKEDFSIKSPGKGLPPYMIKKIVGQTAQRDLKKGDFIFEEDFIVKKAMRSNFKFKRPWGIPVRYHDFNQLASICNCDLIEFHYSYKDLDLNPETYLDANLAKEMEYIVHAPELFENDHVLDLTSLDEEYRALSIKYMQKVIDVTASLKTLFPKTKKPAIITNVGGFSGNDFLSEAEKSKRYALLADSLSKLEYKGTEVIAQTMPPYPWHFGGQQFHNLFLNAEEIVSFCQEHNFRICFDVSHSKLACTKFEWDWLDFIDKVAPYTAHLHIVDAKGVDGEGLQIGDGEIDFASFSNHVNKLCPNASFIPEIWQGHKNNGNGFWVALDRLEKWL